jgi:hypothetical protein
MSDATRHWNLYWVESDGEEDCFVVARNGRSARSVEVHMNGFDIDSLNAIKIMQIPNAAEDLHKRQKNNRREPWPGYVYGKKFFEVLGAEFRIISGREEMLLQDIVYIVEEYVPCGIRKARKIGIKAATEILNHPDFSFEYDDEDIWSGPEKHLITMLGMCLVRCQQIENYITHSFLLGISEKQKKQYETINDLRLGWKKKTLGNMLHCMQEAWTIDPLVKMGFELFLQERNLLIHGITTEERFDIQTSWGQKELLAFLVFFDVHSRIVKKAFRAAYYASIDFAMKQWGKPKGLPKNLLTKKQKDEIGLFVQFFSPKDDGA